MEMNGEPEALLRLRVRRQANDRGLGAMSSGTLVLFRQRITYQPSLAYRVPGFRLGWDATRDDLVSAEVVRRLPVSGGSKPRARVRLQRSSGEELIFSPRDGDVPGVTEAISGWIASGEISYDTKATGTEGADRRRRLRRRRIFLAVLVMPVMMFLGLGFALGYFVFGSRRFW